MIYFQPCASPRPLNTASKKTKMGAEKISWPTLADTGRHLADIWPTSDFIVSRIVFTIALVGPTCRPTCQNIWLRMIAGRHWPTSPRSPESSRLKSWGVIPFEKSWFFRLPPAWVWFAVMFCFRTGNTTKEETQKVSLDPQTAAKLTVLQHYLLIKKRKELN